MRLRDPGLGIGREESPTVNASVPPAVAYGLSTEETPKFAEDESPTLKPPSPSGGGQPGAVVHSESLTERGREGGRNLDVEEEVAPALRNPGEGGRTDSRVVAAFTKTHGAQDTEDAELWEETETMRPLDSTAFATDVVVEGEPAEGKAEAFRWHMGGDESNRVTLSEEAFTLDEMPPAILQTEEVGPLRPGGRRRATARRG